MGYFFEHFTFITLSLPSSYYYSLPIILHVDDQYLNFHLRPYLNMNKNGNSPRSCGLRCRNIAAVSYIVQLLFPLRSKTHILVVVFLSRTNLIFVSSCSISVYAAFFYGKIKSV